jgi:uncharacterized protein
MKQANVFSPWVHTTYACNCRCPYCIVPASKTKDVSMSSENFEKMCQISEKVIDTSGIFDKVSFRLSGGEPLLVYKNYKEIVTKYVKNNRSFSFGVLSNLTILTDDLLKWLKESTIGVQVSLDDLENSKPLANGQSSSKIAIQNIKRLRQEGISFSINTVVDLKNTKSLKSMVEYICSMPDIILWGLSSSYLETVGEHADEMISIFKEAISELLKRNFNIRNKLRFYDIILGAASHCSTGVNIFVIGPKLEVWPCYSLIGLKKPLGYFDENIEILLSASKDNRIFYNRETIPECTDCSILHFCRGGCRSMRLINGKSGMAWACKIKKRNNCFHFKKT